MSPKVLITATHYPEACREGYQLLQTEGFDLIANPYGRMYTQAELLAAVGDIDAVIANMEPWGTDILAAAPNLRVIARFGTGIDNIDLEAARRRGITVTNSPGINAPAVAELTAALVLSLSRRVPQLDASVHAGFWPRLRVHELRGRTLGIIGFGAIGQQVAKVMSGFGMTILAFNRSAKEEVARTLGVTLCPFEEVIARSDVLSLHLPSRPETFHLIDAAVISRMKAGALLINTARGPVVDEQAACAALQSGRLGGMASDVFEQEPVSPDHPLLSQPGFICTPHVAGETFENYAATGLATARSVIDAFAGRDPWHRIV